MHKLRDVSPLNGKIRLKVGIVRVWKPYTFDGDVKVISSFEMVLVDEEVIRLVIFVTVIFQNLSWPYFIVG